MVLKECIFCYAFKYALPYTQPQRTRYDHFLQILLQQLLSFLFDILYVDAGLKDELQRCVVAIHVILTLNCSYTIHSFWLFSYLQSQQPSPWITCNINHNDSPIKPQFEIVFILWPNRGEHQEECFSHSSSIICIINYVEIFPYLLLRQILTHYKNSKCQLLRYINKFLIELFLT